MDTGKQDGTDYEALPNGDRETQSANILIGIAGEEESGNLPVSPENFDVPSDNSAVVLENTKTTKASNKILGEIAKETEKQTRRRRAHSWDDPPKTLEEAELRRIQQNLAHREKLIKILRTLFLIQMVFMNVIVLVIVLWVALGFTWLNDVSVEVLSEISGITKFYVTAVLVELLGGIIFIVQSVFRDKKDEMK